MQLDQYDVKLASKVLPLTRQSIWHLLPEGIKRRVNPIYQVCFLFVNVVGCMTNPFYGPTIVAFWKGSVPLQAV